ncbi:hypothetical protein SAMN05660199_02808 [Klenkia soli]|uniref:Uncharacterized protein n=1 Tax=Klenkia soli TaxID=1052260 RepID=A0A1H0NBH9_9ACTN|nr:hypothetical protein [Klenkia soli]SDO90011.1 hypothetical protein SAMN05660199_02808 [Klenkia soli]
MLDGHDVPVFDEIQLWERSSVPTCSVVLTVSHDDDLDELLSDLDRAGLTGENWTTSVRMLCAACSSGSPGAHDHPFGSSDGGDRTLGISGHAEAVEAVLAGWRDRREGRGHGRVAVELA